MHILLERVVQLAVPEKTENHGSQFYPDPVFLNFTPTRFFEPAWRLFYPDPIFRLCLIRSLHRHHRCC